MPKLVCCALAALLLLATAGGAAAANDTDRDGYVAGDCAPLDPAVNPGATDEPDLAFEDRNCDGIDGDPRNAVFAAPAGNDGNPGTRTQPVQSLQHAVNLARSQRRDVYAAVGTYGGGLRLDGAVYDGTRVFGGYEVGAWNRTRAHATAVTGAPQAAWVSGARDVVFQLMNFHGSALDGFGHSAYGVRLDAAEVAFVAVTATGAEGRNGKSGEGSSPPGQPWVGRAGRNVNTCTLPGGAADGSAPPGHFKGGAGGAGGDDADGGKDGTAGTRGDPTSAAAKLGGKGGDNGTPGSFTTVDGKNGDPGEPGDPGGHGGGGALGPVEPAIDWLGHTGTAGAAGQNGTGGGGGGGGAGRGDWRHWGSGAGGGQGGHGGRGGDGGTGGGPGGGSFGVYAYRSQVVAVASRFVAAAGGAGGAGGSGADGSPGSEGGLGGTVPDCGITVGRGGEGGDGGPGGAGGHGGGGAGGPSFAVLRAGDGARFAAVGSSFATAAGGAGGTGPGDAGEGATPGPDALAGGQLAGDFDGDGVTDDVDGCPTSAAARPGGCPVRPPALADRNGNGVPDPLDDDDRDGVPNSADRCPAQRATVERNRDGCQDAVAPPAVVTAVERIAVGISWNVTRRGVRTRFDRLLVRDVPAGATVEARCSGKRRACPRRTFRSTRAGDVRLRPFVGRYMPAGTRITILITKPGAIGKRVVYTLRRGRNPRSVSACTAPGGGPAQCG